MTTVIPATGKPLYVCVPDGNGWYDAAGRSTVPGWFSRIRIIAWERDDGAPAAPVTIQGKITPGAPWLLYDDEQLLAMPEGRKLTPNEARDWLYRLQDAAAAV